MAEVETGDVLRVGATWQMAAAYEITNVYHVLVQAGGGISYAAAGLDIQEYMEDIAVEIEPRLSDEMITDYLTLSNPTQGTTFGAMAWKTLLQGDITVEATAFGVCLFAYARTIKPRVQIRKYYGVFSEGGIVDSSWSNTERAACEAALDVHALPWSAGTYLTLQGVAYNRTLQTYAIPIGTTTSQEPAYQRRRKRGRGS